MPRPVRHLPVLQNWDCHGCTNCCREYHVHVTDEEQRRITEQGWENDPRLQGVPLFTRSGQGVRLNHHADDRCVFLSDAGRCRIHERYGAAAKPLVCRIFPFVLVPAGDHWRAGMRYACPSAADNKGRQFAAHEDDLQRYAAELERRESVDMASPLLQRGQHMDWPDLHRFNQALLGFMRDRHDRVERRLRKGLALARLCRQSRFDQITGGRLVEFLNLLSAGLDGEAPAGAATLPPPGWVGRVLFRQALALYLRQDHGPDRGVATQGYRARTAAIWRFARGRGEVPKLHARIPTVTFDQLEQPAGPWPDTVEHLLERYYSVKLGSMQFCGVTNFGAAFWDGFEALALTLPMIAWLARAFTDQPREAAFAQAVGIIDNPFGYNVLLGTARQRLAVRLLAGRGELDRLIAWYAR